MCSIDSDDHYTDLGETTQRARKPRECVECGRIIAVGERYHTLKSVYDGYFSAAHMCEHCGAARSWLMVHCGGYIITGARDDLQDHINEGHKEDRLHRLVVGMRRKWKRFDGAGLLPVPALVVRDATLDGGGS